MGEIIIKFVAIHCSLTTLYHRLGQQLFTACASFLVAAFHGMCIVFGSGFPRLFTACVSFLAAAFHGMCIVFGSGFPRLSTTCVSFLAAAFHDLCIVFLCLSWTVWFYCRVRPLWPSAIAISDFVNASPIFNQPYSFLTKTNKTLAVTQGLRPLFLLRLRLAPKQASASWSRRRNSLRSSGLLHSKKNLENKPERS